MGSDTQAYQLFAEAAVVPMIDAVAKCVASKLIAKEVPVTNAPTISPNTSTTSIMRKVAVAERRHSVFVYRYGDADNVSAPGRLLLRGEYSIKVEESLRAACDSHEYFVAEQIGVPALSAELYKLNGGATIDDTAFHEFLSLRPATPDEIASLT